MEPRDIEPGQAPPPSPSAPELLHTIDLPGSPSFPLPGPALDLASRLPLRRLLDLALIVAGLVPLLSAAVMFGVHHSDRWGVNQVTGVWLALVEHAQAGHFYPELFDGERYGGTRYMPLSVGLLVVVAEVFGDTVLAAKVTSAVLMSATLAVVWLLLRRAGCSRPVTFAFLGATMVAKASLNAAVFAFRGDTLSLFLQILALYFIQKPLIERRWLYLAAIACGLAALAKSTGVWGFLSIATFLALSDRSRFLRFIATFVGVFVAGMFFFNALSDGRMWLNLTELSASSGRGMRSLLGSPGKLLHFLVRDGLMTWVLLPLVGMDLLFSLLRRRFSLYHLAVVYAGVLLMIAMTDVGVHENHMVDLNILCIIAAGELLVRAVSRDRILDRHARPGGDPLRQAPVLLLLVVWAMIGGFDMHLSDPLRGAIKDPRAERWRRDVLAPYVSATDRIIAEDPGVPVGLGQIPVVMDPCMLARIGEKHPHLVAPLEERVRRQEFDKIVLLDDVEHPAQPTLYTELNFGPGIAEQIKAKYCLSEVIYDYHIYVPKPEGATKCFRPDRL